MRYGLDAGGIRSQFLFSVRVVLAPGFNISWTGPAALFGSQQACVVCTVTPRLRSVCVIVHRQSASANLKDYDYENSSSTSLWIYPD